ncbi:MAG: AMP-binding protein [Parvibaculum sp.]|nr:AMP-binding protein [Parvibaculum sp.]
MTMSDWSFLDAYAASDPMVRRGQKILSANDVRLEAVRLKALLVHGDDPVFLYCEDSGNFLAGLIAALSAGRDVLLPGHAAPGFLVEIGATGPLLLTDQTGLDAGATIISVEPQHGVVAPSLEIDTGATIGFFTSGSTGAPKTCIKSQAQILSEAAAQLVLWGAPCGPVIGTVSHQHIYGLLFRVFWPLMARASVEAMRQDMWEDVIFHAREGCVFVSSPAHLSRIPDGLSLVHRPAHIFSSGGPLAFAASRDAFIKFGQVPIEVLGSTETGGVAWRQQHGEGEHWTPLPQVEISSDENGALAVRSPFAGGDDFVVMGDQVTRHEDGRFSLHARLDRIVKIEGKRVSLPRVEEALKGLAAITDAVAIDLPERNGALGAVVVVAPEATAELSALGAFRFSRVLRRHLSARLEPMELPRLWRFVERVPENAQGKRLAADMRALFSDSSNDVPRILERNISEMVAEFSLELNPDLRWFAGHFPEQPILPGVAQLHIASVLAEEVWGFVATGSDMARVKFRHVMQPGAKVLLTLTRNGDERLDFRYLMNGEVAASGAIKGIEA